MDTLSDEQIDVAAHATAPNPGSLGPRMGLLRFDIIDERGWQWTILHLNKQTREMEVLDLTEETRTIVNDRRNRFSWTGDGRRDIQDQDKRVHFEQRDDGVVQVPIPDHRYFVTERMKCSPALVRASPTVAMQDPFAQPSGNESSMPDSTASHTPEKRRAPSPGDDDNISTKRRRTASPLAVINQTASTSRVIVPSLPRTRSPSVQEEQSSDSEEDEQAITAPVYDPVPESYTISPAAERIDPATSLEELLGRRRQSTRLARPTRTMPVATGDVGDEIDELDYYDDEENSYRPGFNLHTAAQAGPSNNNASTSSSAIVDLTEAPSPRPSTRASSSSSASSSLPPAPPLQGAGSSTTSAILIQDSPTPPLRPLADPVARMEASANGRCGVLGGDSNGNNEPSPEKEEEKVTLGELVCPICLGPPTPLVLTECGHAFCGPCLHSALTSQPITQQTLRDLPNIGGKDLEGTCPVCRHALAGGWGKALRGAVLRMAEVEVPC